MAELAEGKIKLVRSMVEASPDRVVNALLQALASTGGDPVLGQVRRLVEAEAEDRRLRNIALQPVAAMFIGDGKAKDKVTFPVRALTLIWGGLKSEAPAAVARAAAALDHMDEEEFSPEPFDTLGRMTAEALRSRRSEAFAQAAQLCDEARDGGAGLIGGCLDLGPVVRRATGRLNEWVNRKSDANAAAARLAYKDAVAIADDAGALFFEMLAAQLARPWMVLRIISAVMDRPTESYFAQSEFAPFAYRLMESIDAGLAGVKALDTSRGGAAGVEAAKTVDTLTSQLSELEESIELQRTGPWGERIAAQKVSLAAVVEGHLRAAPKAVAVAAPTQASKLLRLLKQVPKLSAPPDPAAVRKALALLRFTDGVRSAANYGGYASARAKVIEKLDETFDHYVEEVLDRIRHGDVEDPDIARQFLEVIAQFVGAIHDGKAADVVRRRAAAAAPLNAAAAATG